MAKIPVDSFIQIEAWLRDIIRDEIQTVLQRTIRQTPKSSIEPISSENNILSLKKAAEYMGISSPMMHRIRREGRIGCYRIGRRILFSKTDHLDPYLHSNSSE